MTSKAKGDSVRQRLLKLNEKVRISFANLETTFLIERLVARLISDAELSKCLVFKGGFVGLRVYDSPRYTVDLDALLVKADLASTLLLTKSAAEVDLGDGVWFRFESQIELKTQGQYGGIRQTFRAGIGEVLRNLRKAQVVHFDLGIGDPITPKPSKVKTPALLAGENLSWSVYPIETIVAEKLHAIVAHGEANSRSKDIHDLALFLPKADRKTLKDALGKCFSFRETTLPESFSSLLKTMDTKMLKRGWANASASLPGAPKFDEVFARLVSQMEIFEK